MTLQMARMFLVNIVVLMLFSAMAAGAVGVIGGLILLRFGFFD